MGVLRILIITTYVMLLLGQVVRVNAFYGITVTPLDVALMCLLVFFIFSQVTKKRKLGLEKFHLFLIAFTGIGFFSLLLQIHQLGIKDFIVSLAYLLRYLLYLSPLFFLPAYIKNKGKELLIDTAFVGIIFMVFGLLQYFFFPSLKAVTFVGQWDMHEFRLFGTFLDPNYAGIFLLMELFLLLSFYFMEKVKNTKNSMLLVLILCLISILLTFSRSTLVALFFSVGIYLFFYRKLKYLIPAFLVMTVTLVAIFVYSKNFTGEGVNYLRTASVEARLQSYKDGLDVFFEHPILGVGFNAYRFERKDLGASPTGASQNSNALNAPSNSLVFILATTGVAGLFAFLGFVFFLIKFMLGRVKNNPYGGFYITGATIILGVFVHGFFQNTLFYSPVLLFLEFIIVGILALPNPVSKKR